MIKIKKKQVIPLVLYSVINVCFNFGILFILNKVLTEQGMPIQYHMGIVFFSLIVYSYLLNQYFQKKIVSIAYDFVYTNEIDILKKIQSISLKKFESLGTERIYGIIEDIRAFVTFPNMFTNTIDSLLMIALCLGYMFTISMKGAFIVLFLIVIIALTYVLVSKKMAKKFIDLRNQNDHYNKNIDDLLKGFKELKISRTRSWNYLENFVKPNREYAKSVDVNLTYGFIMVKVLSQYGLYFIFGCILFVIPLFGFIKVKEIVSFVVVLLFMRAPINKLMMLQNMYTRIYVASKRILSFYKDISVPIVKEQKNIPISNFYSLEFKNCTFQYEEEHPFHLGPINFKITKGEIIFIIGGNGSGKSTLIKMLTGLYKPTSGEVLLNGKSIDIDSENYQELLSVIFTNNYLFSKNYENYSLKGNEKYNDLLTLMELKKVVKDDDEKSARRYFSKGQGKRMSMIFALMEEHPLMILDEWAADQDPYFRKYFYEKLLPKFKDEGKTIIAVTHDDAYFYLADRILKLDYGQIVDDINTNEKIFKKELLWNN